jgi:hypothetical protein
MGIGGCFDDFLCTNKGTKSNYKRKSITLATEIFQAAFIIITALILIKTKNSTSKSKGTAKIIILFLVKA